MAVSCTKCGAELIGSVNRCWSCGQEFEVRPDTGAKPPVRRSPVLGPLDVEPGAESLMLSELAPAANTATVDEAQTTQEDVRELPTETSPTQNQENKPKKIHVGSPFAAPSGGSGRLSSVVPQAELAPHMAPAVPTRYPKNMAASSGAIICMVLGLFSIACSFYTPFAIVTALLGIGMGIWGLSCHRRKFAMIGIMLCCIAMALGGFNGVVDFYFSIHGVKPWEANMPLEEDSLPVPIEQFSR